MNTEETQDSWRYHDFKADAEAIRFLRKLERERDDARKECEEQARLLGMSAEREAKLLAEVQRLREQVLRAEAWPFDPNPFTSADHDNDHRYP
jgi:hypothetical protein